MTNAVQIIETETFYNRIAPEYDKFMTGSAIDFRNLYSAVFKQYVKNGAVLDFGGGTGLDLPWLLDYFNKVWFIEPSSGMREQAKQTSFSMKDKDKLVILDQNLDFMTWQESDLPFQGLADGISANFAVLNCIENPQMLFEKIALLCKEGGYFLATVIDPAPLKLRSNYEAKVAIKALLRKKIVICNNYNGVGHSTYIHSVSHIKRASSGYFNLIEYKPVKETVFAIIVLRRK
jgi:SAM-dependent methyltransferase